jgi:hypothetical protein
VDANLRGREGDAANKEKIRTTAMEKEKERARTIQRRAIARGGAGLKTMTMEAAVEATAIIGGVDTGAATTATTATTAKMVTGMTMTRRNICDASTEEKEHPSNP